MKKIVSIYIISLLFISCKQTDKKQNIGKSKNKIDKTRVVNDNLIGFKTSITEVINDDEYVVNEMKVDNANLQVKYIDDIIYISYYEKLNVCGLYDGNIQISNDSIKLKIDLISESCESKTKALEKITFLIDNPDKKKKIILK